MNYYQEEINKKEGYLMSIYMFISVNNILMQYDAYRLNCKNNRNFNIEKIK